MNLQSTIENKRYTFPIFFLIAACTYWYAAEAGFYEDFLEFVKLCDKSTFTEFVLSPEKSLYQGVNIFHYIFIKLFRLEPIPWLLLFTALHAGCATMLLRFLNRWFKLMKWNDYGIAAISTAILFLLSPVVTEVLVWRACSHYLTTTLAILFVLNWLIKYFETGYKRYPWLIGITFYISTFLLEYFYLIPPFVILLTFSAFFAKVIDGKMLKHAAFTIFLPICVLFFVYFITLYLKLHTTLARVNSEGSQQITPGFVFDRFSKYTIRVYLLDYFMPNTWRSFIETFTATKKSVIATALVLTSIAGIGAYKYRVMQAKWKIAYTLFLLSYTSCIVILPMWYYNSFTLLGSRYYYLPSIFFYSLFCVFITALFKSRAVANSIIVGYLLINISGLLQIINSAGKAGKISKQLIENFKWKDGETVLLLNLPENYNGVSMIQSHIESSFHDNLRIFLNDTVKGTIYDVASHNMVSEIDGAYAVVEDSVTVKVRLNQYGTWWWFGSFGAPAYENDLYKFTPVEEGFSYILSLKQKPGPDTRIVLRVGTEWKTIDMSKIGVEQR